MPTITPRVALIPVDVARVVWAVLVVVLGAVVVGTLVSLEVVVVEATVELAGAAPEPDKEDSSSLSCSNLDGYKCYR